MDKRMERSNIEYIGAVIMASWTAFVKAPFVVKCTAFIASFLLGLWLDLYVFILGIPVIAVMDAHLAIKACIKKRLCNMKILLDKTTNNNYFRKFKI